MKQVKNTLEKIGKEKYWAVFDNQLIQGNLNGRHLMGISAMDTWAKVNRAAMLTSKKTFAFY